jgi:Family of unknown function (DUF6477)
MAGKTRYGARAVVGTRASLAAPGVFDTMSQAGADCYLRARDLPRLVALWPHELLDQSPEGGLHILSKLRRALRAERRRGRAGHWSYELNRHVGLLSAYRGELALLRRTSSLSHKPPVAGESTSEVEGPDMPAKSAPRLHRPSR